VPRTAQVHPFDWLPTTFGVLYHHSAIQNQFDGQAMHKMQQSEHDPRAVFKKPFNFLN
jgi:hypothetical protein